MCYVDECSHFTLYVIIIASFLFSCLSGSTQWGSEVYCLFFICGKQTIQPFQEYLSMYVIVTVNACINVYIYTCGLCTDDDNRVVLKQYPGHEDCQHDYINASYIDVSITS